MKPPSQGFGKKARRKKMNTSATQKRNAAATAIDEATIADLNAGSVEAALLQQQPVSATRTYPITVGLHELFGNAQLTWSLDPNYAIGDQDVVQLREGFKFIKNWPVTGHSGTVDTGHVWGSGLNASYWAWDYASKSWKQLVVSPNTTDQ
jgi:hypothetical protein